MEGGERVELGGRRCEEGVVRFASSGSDGRGQQELGVRFTHLVAALCDGVASSWPLLRIRARRLERFAIQTTPLQHWLQVLLQVVSYTQLMIVCREEEGDHFSSTCMCISTCTSCSLGNATSYVIILYMYTIHRHAYNVHLLITVWDRILSHSPVLIEN